MNMTEVKTAELVGVGLDWAVANCAGWKVEIKPHGQYSNASTGRKLKARAYRLWMVSDVEPEECAPSSDWSQGGPLTEKYRVSLEDIGVGWIATPRCIVSAVGSMQAQDHESLLVAAMRAIVCSGLGDVVSVPSELLEKTK